MTLHYRAEGRHEYTVLLYVPGERPFDLYDPERRDQLYELVRFKSTRGDWVSLKDYVAGLKENQTAIYYLTAEDLAKAKASPQLEGYRARDVEVLLLTDPVDSFWVRTALGYEGKPFKSVTQGSADLDLIKLKDEAKSDASDDAATAVLAAALKQALEDLATTRPLHSEACGEVTRVRHHHVIVCRELLFEVRPVRINAGGIHYEEKLLLARAVGDQIIHHTAFVIQQQRVLALTGGEL